MTEFTELIYALIVFLGGLAASFFFSGTEIGFYRVSRAKLVLEALKGCKRTKFLLWLTNNPPIFISTVLLGNNLANNFVSLGSVLLFQILFPNSSAALLSTAAATPLVFIYGELLPKSIFLKAPSRLMKRSSPIYVILVPLFLPVSLFLSGLNSLIAYLLGEKNPHYPLQMTDAELKNMLGEGKSAGILHQTQQSMAEKIIHLQSIPISESCSPLKNFPFVNENMTRAEMLQTARKAGTNWILTQKTHRALKKYQPDGFYFFSDLLLTPEDKPLPMQKLLVLPASTTFAEAMGKMFVSDVPFAVLSSPRGDFIGVVRRQIPRG